MFLNSAGVIFPLSVVISVWPIVSAWDSLSLYTYLVSMQPWSCGLHSKLWFSRPVLLLF